MEPSVDTKLFAIFGNPVGHSLSPLMHNSAFGEYNIDALYLPFEVTSIKDAVDALRTLRFSGASITIPHKIDVITFCDELTDDAKNIGAVNTLIDRQGRIIGDNTDGRGALEALMGKGFNPVDSEVLLIGYGGSARAIGMVLAREKSKVTITGRNIKKAEELEGEINSAHPGSTTCISIDDVDKSVVERCRCIINTTPVSMEKFGSKMPMELPGVGAAHTIFDIVYSPHITPLLKYGYDKGAAVVHGIDMLIYQGILQFELWHGVRPDYHIFGRPVLEKLNV